MKKRIEQLLSGKFEYSRKQPELSVKEIEARTSAGEPARGSFVIRHPEGRRLRGVVYPSSPRLLAGPEVFQAIETKISWQVDTAGLSAGDVSRSEITVCTQLGEVSVPVTVYVLAADGSAAADPVANMAAVAADGSAAADPAADMAAVTAAAGASGQPGGAALNAFSGKEEGSMRSAEAAEAAFEAASAAGGLTGMTADSGSAASGPVGAAAVSGGDKTDDGVPDAVRELTAMAQEDFLPAAAYFVSESFAQKVRQLPVSIRTLYEAFASAKDSARGLEEFLIGCGQKEPVELTLEDVNTQELEAETSVRETLHIRRSGWGYLEMELSAEGNFLRLEKKKLTTLSFLGNDCEIGYIIDTNFLHAGKNCARIRVRTCYQTLETEVTAIGRSRESVSARSDGHRERRIGRLMARKAELLYIDYRLGRIDRHTWVERSLNVVAGSRRSGEESIWADLFHVYLLEADGKRVRAEKLLRELETQPSRLQTPDRYLCWLCLSTLFTRDEEYHEAVRRRARSLSAQNRGNWVISFLMLHFMEEEFTGAPGKLTEIVRQVEGGCASPLLLVEGALILKENPFLLHRIASPQRLILYFAARRGLTDEALTLQIASIELSHPEYHPVLERTLRLCYEQTGLRDALAALASVLIEGKKNTEKYFPVYAQAVRYDLKITGLYEYYMETMQECRVETMPQTIRRYLVYNDALDWRKKAKIFRNLSDLRENIPDIYRSCKPQIEKFLIDQLAMCHVDENLAVLYDRYLTRAMLTPALARKLVTVLFTFEVTCKNPRIRAVIAADERLVRQKVVPLLNQKAQVQLYSENSRILLEDETGSRYCSTSLYMAEHMLDAPRLLQYCVQMVPDEPGLVLFGCLSADGQGTVQRSDISFFLRAANLNLLTEESRGRIRKALLDYYTANPDDETLYRFLRDMDIREYAGAGKQQLVSLLTQEGLYEEAYTLVREYGSEHLPIALLVRVCSQTVLAREYEADTQLTRFCAQCFFSGKYDEHILAYLILYYEGPIEQMKQLWTVGRQYELDTMGLEQKLLGMILFSGSGTRGADPVYVSFRRSLGNRPICQAYVILKSYEYFVRGEPVSEAVFSDILTDWSRGAKLPDVCALALCQHLSTLVERSELQNKAALEILGELNQRGLRFSFFQRYPLSVRMQMGMEDRVFLECVADPASEVRLYWRVKGSGDEYREEVMKDLFEGIRVREFILFTGEELECCTEETDADGQVTSSGIRTLRARRVPSEMVASAFGAISAMTQHFAEGDEEKAREALEQYRQTDILAREFFTLM